jgi:hypothetical protein
MATPIIRSTQTGGGGVGTAGQGRNDLDTGIAVDLEDTEAANSGLTYSWAFLDKPIGSSASLTNPTTATPSFTPDVTGSYVIRCRVSSGGALSGEAVEILAVPLTTTAARIPSLGEQLEYDGGGNTKGWHEALTVFMRAVDSTLTTLSGQLAGAGTVDTRLDAIEAQLAGAGTVDTRLDALEAADVSLDSRLDTLEGQTLDARLDTLEAAFGKYAIVALSATQSSNMAVSNHVEFDTEWDPSSIISLTTGSGQTDGDITLSSGHKYIVLVLLQCTINEGEIQFRWCDTSNVALNDASGQLGSQIRAHDSDATDGSGSTFGCAVFDATGGAITMRLVIQAVTNITSINISTRVLILALT